MNKVTDARPFRFAVTGVINTIAGTAVMFGLYNLLGCTYWVSSAANYIIGSILSYVLNRRYTFRYSGSTVKSGLRFAVNIAVCYLTAYGAAKPAAAWMLAGTSVSLQENLAMFAGMCIFTVLNYIGQRFFVFGDNVMNYREEYEKWMNSSSLSDEEKKQLAEMSEEEISDAFYKRLEFGTAGMRGVMGLGTNRLNRYMVRMAAKGLADMLGEGSKVAVAFDTRHHSRELAEEASGVLAACGINALLFDRYSPVPLLSFAVRDLACDGGIVITASHNTSEYNGFKVYDNTGCQLCNEPAAIISGNMDKLDDPLAIAVAAADDDRITRIGQQVVDRFMDAVQECGADIDSEAAAGLKVVYTSLHGSGRDYVMKTLERAGFSDVMLVDEQSDYNGDFPTVRKPNPEDPAAFAIAERIALENDADIIIGTDPDSDRIGAGVRHDGKIVYLSGNQTGTLIVDFLGRMRGAEGKKLITSIVTGDMGPAVAESYGAETVRTYTGFKNLGAEMNRSDDSEILMAYEESFGYLAGTHIRDKDGVSSSLLVCQMAAYWKQKGCTLIDALEQLYQKHGYYIDDQSSFVFEGEAGAQKIASLMEWFREKREDALCDAADVESMMDYSEGIDGLPPDNVLRYVLKNGSWLAVRPSGTEPKIKFYYCVKGSDRDAAEELHSRLKQTVEDIVNINSSSQNFHR